MDLAPVGGYGLLHAHRMIHEAIWVLNENLPVISQLRLFPRGVDTRLYQRKPNNRTRHC